MPRCFHAFSCYFETLARAYGLDALETGSAGEAPLPEVDARTFLGLIWATHAERFPAIGEEEDIPPSRSGRRPGRSRDSRGLRGLAHGSPAPKSRTRRFSAPRSGRSSLCAPPRTPLPAPGSATTRLRSGRASVGFSIFFARSPSWYAIARQACAAVASSRYRVPIGLRSRQRACMLALSAVLGFQCLTPMNGESLTRSLNKARRLRIHTAEPHR